MDSSFREAIGEHMGSLVRHASKEEMAIHSMQEKVLWIL